MRRFILGNGTVTARVSAEFAALLEALQFQGADNERLLCLNDQEWRDLLELADLAHVTLPLAMRRTRDMPAWVINRLETNLSDNGRRFEAVYLAYSEVAAALKKAGIDHIVLKGFTQAPEFVSDPHVRMQSDLDLYCSPGNTDAARKVLECLGYSPLEGLDYRAADHGPTHVRRGTWVWHGNAYDPGMPPSVEIHFCLWNEAVSRVSAPGVEAFWARRRKQVYGKYIWWALQREDKVAFLALHILRGVFSGDWIVHHVFELASFLNSSVNDVEFWDQWTRLQTSAGRNMQAIGFSLAQSWFCCKLAPTALASIEGLPERERKWLRQFSGSPLESMFRRNRDGRLLQLSMVAKRSDRQALLRRMFIPTVSRPNTLATNFENRRPVTGSGRAVITTYLRYLLTRTAAFTRSTTEVMFHGVSLWLAGRPFSSGFWALLGACFFLTWGSLFTTSFSICI